MDKIPDANIGGKGVACVTGASGIVGRRIVSRLLENGWSVRALVPDDAPVDVRASLYKGDLRDAAVLRSFTEGAQAMFHCAAELRDESRMWQVNVEGTKNVVNAASGSGTITYLCHLSSAGVVGNVALKDVDESVDCHPFNVYEKSKWEAEQIAGRVIAGCRVVILRPTNVVDEQRLGAMSVVAGGWKNRLRLFLKGGERAHVVHADDVAAAAVYLMQIESTDLQCYFVSCDEDPLNTYAGICALFTSCREGSSLEGKRLPLHMPLIAAHAARRLTRGKRNRGDVRFSSQKLLSTGFVFPNGLRGAVQRIAENM